MSTDTGESAPSATDARTDGRQYLPDGNEADAVAALLDGMDVVTAYRKKRGITDKRLSDSGGIFSSRMAGGYEGWQDELKPAAYARDQWNEHCSHLHVHEASYTVFDRHGRTHCTIIAQASAQDDVDPATGERVDDPYGIKGDITITGVLPQDTLPEEYIDQQLERQG